MIRSRPSHTIAPALLALAAACSSDPGSTGPGSSDPNPDTVIDEVVGRYEVRVDISNPDSPVIDIESAPVSGEDGGASAQALTAVISDVRLNGPGTWDAASRRLSATVRITNLGTRALDEPRMNVLWVSVPTIVYEEIHYGSGGAGSGYAFADIEAPPGANGASAKQRMVMYDPEVKNFSYQVEIVAGINSPAKSIAADNDDDRFNEEPVQPAGDDCNDNNASVLPGAGGCLCSLGCLGCGAQSCCEETCGSSCSPVCASGCTCSFKSSGNQTAVCMPSSTCSITANSGSTADTQCRAATCDTTCAGTNNCQYSRCESGATCTASCNDASNCGVETCSGSTCTMACQRSSTCRFDLCTAGSTCSLSCSQSVSTCEIKQCTGSNCNVTCGAGVSKCALDCSGGAAGTKCRMTCPPSKGSCNLKCPAGETVLTCPGGVKACSGTGC